MSISDDVLRWTDASSEMIFLISPTFCQFIYTNNAFDEFWGDWFDDADDVRDRLLTAVHPDDRATIDQVFSNPPDDSQILEYRVIHPHTEEIHWFRQKMTPVWDSGGSLQQFGCIFEEITDQKQTHRKLQLFRDTLDQSPDLFYFFDPESARFQDVLGQAEERLGYTKEELKSMSIADIDPNVDQDYDWIQYVRDLKRQGAQTFESLHRRKDGTTFPIFARNFYIQLGDLNRIVSIVRDISDEKKRELKFQQMAENIEEVFYIKDLDRNEFTYVSPAIESMLGYSPEKLLGKSGDAWLKWIHPSDRTQVGDQLSQQQTGDFDLRYRIQRTDGQVRWIHDKAFPVETPSEHEPTQVVGVAEDITEEMELREKLQQQALYDPLTQLPNRTLFEDRLEMAIHRCRRQDDWPLAVVYLDLDDFKQVNDTYGHSFGDELLRRLGSRFLSVIREEDTVARFGGDEFLILLEDISRHQDASRFLERLKQSVKEPFSVEGTEITVSISVGVELATKSYHDPKDLIRDADTAMFQAKRDQSRSIYFYDRKLESTLQRSRNLHSDLETAFDRDQFVLHYQPILDASNHQVIGLEALVRWQHPQEGLLYPRDFLSVALESNTLPDMDRHIMRNVCSFIHSNKELFKVTPLEWVSVNISEQLFLQADASKWIIQQLSEWELPFSRCRIEVTERTAIDKLDVTTDNFCQLEESGIRLAIDDFGTGYSSLTSVNRLPVDILKIDRTLVSDLTCSDDQRAILSTAIQLANVMELSSVVEGIETTNQLNLVRELGGKYVQGFLFDHALEPKKIRDRLLSKDQ